MKIGVWVDGAMPNRAETVRGYVQAMHLAWLSTMAAKQPVGVAGMPVIDIQTRYRYNPDVKVYLRLFPQ